MSVNVRVTDARVGGRVPRDTPDHVFRVNRFTSLCWCLTRVVNYARAHGGINVLEFHCHGFEDLHDEYPAGGSCTQSGGQTVVRGAAGLALCREGLTLDNVRLTRRLRGHVRVIVLYACMVAHTHRDMAGTAADGQEFCRKLAVHSGAEVYASDATQRCRDAVNCGAWEGRLFVFTPDGAPGRLFGEFPL